MRHTLPTAAELLHGIDNDEKVIVGQRVLEYIVFLLSINLVEIRPLVFTLLSALRP